MMMIEIVSDYPICTKWNSETRQAIPHLVFLSLGPFFPLELPPEPACSIYSTWNKLLVFEDSFPFSYFPWNLSGFHSIFCVGSSAQDIPKSTAIVVPTSCPQPTFIYRDLSGPWYLFITFICYNTCLSLEVSKFLVGSMHVCLVTQLCPTLCDTVDCSLPDSSVLRIFQARKLKWVAISLFRGSSQPGIRPVSLVSSALQTDSSPTDPSGKPCRLHVAAAAKSLQSCPTLCDPTDSSPPGSPIPGILQARTLEWVVISFSSA